MDAQPTAVVAETTTWPEFPALWPRLLDEVWTAVRTSGWIAAGRNVMLYLDDAGKVEIGVEAAGVFEPVGRVVPSTLPAGRVATAMHRGSYARIGSAHDAVVAWCDEHGVERTGVRWEVYGHATEREADQEVEVFYLLR